MILADPTIASHVETVPCAPAGPSAAHPPEESPAQDDIPHPPPLLLLSAIPHPPEELLHRAYGRALEPFITGLVPHKSPISPKDSSVRKPSSLISPVNISLSVSVIPSLLMSVISIHVGTVAHVR